MMNAMGYDAHLHTLETRVETGLGLSLQHKFLAGDVGSAIGEWVGHAELLPEQVDERPQLDHRHPMSTAVLPQQPPNHGTSRWTWTPPSRPPATAP